MSHTYFKVNLPSAVAWISRNSLLETGDCSGIQTNKHSNHLAKLACLATWLSVYMATKWLWIPIQLQSNEILSTNRFLLA